MHAADTSFQRKAPHTSGPTTKVVTVTRSLHLPGEFSPTIHHRATTRQSAGQHPTSPGRTSQTTKHCQHWSTKKHDLQWQSKRDSYCEEGFEQTTVPCFLHVLKVPMASMEPGMGALARKPVVCSCRTKAKQCPKPKSLSRIHLDAGLYFCKAPPPHSRVTKNMATRP